MTVARTAWRWLTGRISTPPRRITVIFWVALYANDQWITRLGLEHRVAINAVLAPLSLVLTGIFALWAVWFAYRAVRAGTPKPAIQMLAMAAVLLAAAVLMA